MELSSCHCYELFKRQLNCSHCKQLSCHAYACKHHFPSTPMIGLLENLTTWAKQTLREQNRMNERPLKKLSTSTLFIYLWAALFILLFQHEGHICLMKFGSILITKMRLAHRKFACQRGLQLDKKKKKKRVPIETQWGVYSVLLHLNSFLFHKCSLFVSAGTRSREGYLLFSYNI